MIPNLETLVRKSKTEELIDTIDSVRFTFLTTLLLMGKKSVLITGKSFLFEALYHHFRVYLIFKAHLESAKR